MLSALVLLGVYAEAANAKPPSLAQKPGLHWQEPYLGLRLRAQREEG